jgi:hypothetical protein
VYVVGILGSALSSSSSSSSTPTTLLLPKTKQNTFATMQSQPSMTTGTNTNTTTTLTLTTKEESDKVSSTTNSSINSSILQHAYVHKISQTVLQHLQNTHHGWIVSQGLDRGLRLNPNGTFVLQFPNTSRGYDSGRIWYVCLISLFFENIKKVNFQFRHYIRFCMCLLDMMKR